MAAKLQTMRSGGTQHPEEIVNFLMSQYIKTPGVIGVISGDMLVTQETVPAMSVKVAQGHAALKATGSNMAYPGWLTDADASVAISSNASGNPRKDAIVLYIDKGATPNPDITNVLKLTAIAGTPAGSPVSPSDATIQAAIGSANPFLRLADVTVASGAVSILNASILDTRVEAVLDIEKTIANAAAKTTPVNGDLFVMIDSAASNILKVVSWTNIKATLKTYFDAIYFPFSLSGEVSITGAITLDATAFGKMHVCSGTTADYTVGLPAVAGNAGKIIGFRMASGLTKLVTIDGNASETIDGLTTRILWANEVAILQCDGTTWTKIAGKTIPMGANQKAGAAQSINGSTITKATLGTNVYATPAAFSDTANSKIPILRPGKYQIDMQFTWNNVESASQYQWRYRISGTTTYKIVAHKAFEGTMSQLVHGVEDLVAGDYLEAYLYQATAGAVSTYWTSAADYNGLSVVEIPTW